MLSTQQLTEIKQYVLRELPRVLEEDPQFVVFIEGIVSERFPRRDEFARLLDEFTGFREETRESFRKVDQRFEQVDQQFADLREETQQQFAGMREETQRQFAGMREETQRQFAGMREETQRQFTDVRGEIHDLGEDLSENMRDLRDWVELIGGRLQTRAGRNLENTIAGALRLGLSRSDILPENVRLRQKITDPEGQVFRPGKEKEVDIIAQDDELLVFEVKSAPNEEAVDDFADKVELVRLQNQDKSVKGVLFALGREEAVLQRCNERGIQLIP